MEDRERHKREQLLIRYEKAKKKITNWENAVYRTEKRKPSADDMKRAPKDVQESYREYIKIRKYVKDHPNIIPTAKNAKMLTPGKIFLGERRFQAQRSELSYSPRNPVRMFRKSGGSPPKAAPASKTLGLRSSSSRSEDVEDRSLKPMSSFRPMFQKLFSNAVDEKGKVVASKSEKKRDSEGKEPVYAEEDATSENRSGADAQAKGTKIANPFGLNNAQFNEAVLERSRTEKKTVGGENTEGTEKEKESLALKSVRIKSKAQQRMSSRRVDTGWLARVDADDEDERMEDGEQESKNECNSANTSSSDHGIANSPTHNMNQSSVSVSMEDTTMDVDVDTDRQFESAAPTSSSVPIVNFTHENSDSGICLSSMFNAEELHQAVQEVMEETRNSANASAVSMSDADGSLLYSFSEDACHPSDHEEPALDSSIMSNIMKTLSEDIGDYELEEGPETSSFGQVGKRTPAKKRPWESAFSPSPKKPSKAKKFFKSSRGERIRPTYYTGTLFKPPTPIKKSKKPSVPTAACSYNLKSSTSTKIVLQRVNSDNNGAGEPGKEKTAFGSESKDETGEGSITAMPVPPVSTANSKSKPGRKVKKKINYQEDDDYTKAVKEPKASRKSVVIDVFDEAPAESALPARKRGMNAGRRYGRNESLQSKMNRGKVDDNFVRIDTTRKVFVRGHRKISVSKMKRVDWKNRKKNQGKEANTKPALSLFTCHKCGEKGHFAKFCTKGNPVEEDIPAEQQDNSPFPTLEEAARMIYKNPAASSRVNIYTSKDSTQVEEKQPDEETGEATVPEEVVVSTPQLIEAVDPVFSDEFPTDPEFEEETMLEGLREFGYDSFRPGQKEAVLRILKGMSTLVILSTGSGKSLCYQLPAYLYRKKYPGAVTLCISPLVSLMEDQVQGIPPFLNAACLHSNMTTKQKDIVLERFKSKKLDILLVSPEAVCGGLFGLLRGNPDSLPKVSFACIDEVHCVSQWSHNFRPSYLQLCKILREKLKVQTILGLTATATKTTVESICEHLKVDPSTTIRGELIPTNLKLSVSRDLYKDEALINLLRGERFCNCDSIIIYCTRREECQRIATFVRTKLQEITVNKLIKTKSGARLSGSCEAYHAGMTPRRRKNVQEGFMSGAIRIVVATVAFGMGIDKSDIRAVIHYNMPSAFESYVQEIGRAGRDGLPAHCHLFLDNAKKKDLCELKRHVYANSVDRPTIRKLLRKVFQSCKCKRIQELKGEESKEKMPCQGHEVSFSIEKCVMDLDLPKENITTLLCYLELGQKKWIEILPLTYEMCKIQSYGGPKALKFAASRCPPLAVAIALQKEKNNFLDTDSFIEFNVIEAAATVGWNSGVVKKELKNLEWVGSEYDAKGNPTRFRKSGLMVEFSSLAYRLKSPGSLSDEDADEALNFLHGRNVRQERTQLHQLQRVYHALLSVSCPNINNLCDTHDEDKSDQLKKFIHEYFSEEDSSSQEIDLSSSPDINLDAGKVEDLRRSVRHLVDSNRDTDFTGRAVARIFQGISSPCYPSDVWYRNRDFWRRYLDVDFHVICRIASEEL